MSPKHSSLALDVFKEQSEEADFSYAPELSLVVDKQNTLFNAASDQERIQISGKLIISF